MRLFIPAMIAVIANWQLPSWLNLGMSLLIVITLIPTCFKPKQDFDSVIV